MALDKNTVVKEAQKFAAKGQFDKAIAEWKKLLKESPNDPNIYNTIGDLCLKKDAKKDAVDAYKKAADLLAADGFTSKAIALYKKVLNIDNKKIEVHLALGDLNAEKGITGAALESYKIIADHYTHEQDMVKTLGIYQKMADLNPSNVAFRVKLGDMYVKQGMKNEASAAFLAAADVHVSKNAFQDARLLFEKVLSLDPNNKNVYHKAGIVYFREGKFVEACKALKPAFEDDPSNKELADTYLEALSKADKPVEAEAVLKKLLSEDAGRTDLREKLYQLYLSVKDLPKALDEAATLAQVKNERDEPEAAEEILKTFVSQNPQFAPARRKLAEFYDSLGRKDSAAQELLRAAELSIQEGDKDGARELLARAMQFVPGMPEAREMLEQLEPLAATPPPIEEEFTAPEPPRDETPYEMPAPPEEAAIEPAQPAPPAPSPVAEKEYPEINDAFTEADVLIKYGLAAKAAEQLENLALKYPANDRIRVKLRDLYSEQGSAEKVARHTLALSDIYAKRGQNDLANAALQSVLEIARGNPAILAMLGGTQAPAAAPLAEPVQEPVETSPAAFEPPPSAFEETPPMPETGPASDDGSLAFEGLDSQIFGRGQAVTPEDPSVLEQPAEEPPREEPSLMEQFEPPSEEQREAPPVLEQFEQPAPEKPREEVREAPAAKTDIAEVWAEAEFYYQQGLFDEARKHYARIIELSPSDRRAVKRLAEITHEEDETLEFTKLTDAVEGLEDAVSSEADGTELAASASDEEAVRLLMSEIAEIQKEEKAASAPAASPEQPEAPDMNSATSPADEEAVRSLMSDIAALQREEEPALPSPLSTGPSPDAKTSPFATSGKKEAEEDFFDLGAELAKETGAAPSAQPRKEPAEEFFDLAAELRDELGSMAPSAKSLSGILPEEQSLDDIFEEFKKGVVQQAEKEDTGTHYNLGVAYKEMGLLEDAIAEFVMTREGESVFVQSKYMLGLCYMEMGEYQNAVDEIMNALNYGMSRGMTDQERIPMQYDLGLAYQGFGNITSAMSEFQQVYSVDPHYRDTAAKLNELREGDFISLEQLKDDIEREISAKFLEEGERIEREEKSQKTEKSRS